VCFGILARKKSRGHASALGQQGDFAPIL